MQEITEYPGASRSAIPDWFDRRSILTARIGRLRKFQISEIDTWMNSATAMFESNLEIALLLIVRIASRQRVG